MKFVIASTAVLAAALMTGATPALAKPGAEVQIEHAVARVVVIIEDRSDIGVEIDQGTSGLPALRVERRGNEIRIDGGLGQRVAGMRVRDRISNCDSGPSNAARPGEGATVEVRGMGRIDVAKAPMIVIRAPRDVNVGASGAVFGSIGRGARSVDLGNAGCGRWDVANVDGDVSISQAGSGDVRAGTSAALEVSIAGSGSVSAGATRALELSSAGSGDLAVASVEGPVEISLVGSGDVLVRGGTASRLEVSSMGSGDVAFRGTVGDVEVSSMGSGDVSVARVTGNVSRSSMGSGDVHIGG